MSIDYIQLAKDRIAECEGEHNITWVDCTMQVAIANALVSIAESLRKIADGDAE